MLKKNLRGKREEAHFDSGERHDWGDLVIVPNPTL